MAFIGNTPTTQAFTPAVDYFSGNGSTTAFTLSRPVASVAQVEAVVNNVVQNPSSAYTVSNNTITFTSAPSSGTNNIYVRYTSPITQVIAPSQGSVNTTSFASSTGTGAGVFQTSPTINTPTLISPTVSGNLSFASGTNGIIFNNTSATTNSTLNDYETGTWTPTLTAVSNATSLATSQTTYTKIGNFVLITGNFNFNITSSGAETAVKLTLPFQAKDSNSSASGSFSGYVGSGPQRFITANFFNGSGVSTNTIIYMQGNTVVNTGAITGMFSFMYQAYF